MKTDQNCHNARGRHSKYGSKLDKTLRHEIALQRQIDAAVKMLNKDAAQLYAQRTKDLIMDETQTTPRECLSNEEEAVNVELKVQDRLRRIRMDTEAAGLALAEAPYQKPVPLVRIPRPEPSPLSRPPPLIHRHALGTAQMSSPDLVGAGVKIIAGGV